MNKTNAITNTRSIKGGYLSINTTKKFMNIKCKKHGFEISLSNTPDETCIVRKKRLNNKFKIQYRILKAYGIADTVKISQIDANKYLVSGEHPCKGTPPKPLSGHRLHDKTPLPNIDKAKLVLEDKLVGGYKANLTSQMEISRRKVTLHMGEQKFIEIEEASDDDMERFYSIDEIYQEFGRQLSDFVGAVITYTCIIQKPRHFSIPSYFARKAGIERNSIVRIFKTGDNRVIIAPAKDICDISGEEIEPIKKTAIVKEICNDCADDDNQDIIKDLVSLIKELRGKCESILVSKEQERATFSQVINQMDEKERALIARMNQLEKQVQENNVYKDVVNKIANITNEVNGVEQETEIIELDSFM